MMAASVHRGGCLCGAVTFEIAGEFDAFFLCHCSRCRKGSGSAHASNLFSESGTLTWLTGEDLVRTYALPGTRHGRAFCATCGSMLPLKAPSGRLKIPAGSLDTPVEMRPIAQIFDGSRADWDHDLEQVPCFDEGMK